MFFMAPSLTLQFVGMSFSTRLTRLRWTLPPYRGQLWPAGSSLASLALAFGSFDFRKPTAARTVTRMAAVTATAIQRRKGDVRIGKILDPSVPGAACGLAFCQTASDCRNKLLMLLVGEHLHV